MIVIRPSTRQDVIKLYGKASQWSVRALTVDLDGEPVGIGGVYFNGDMYVIFSEITEPLRPYRKTIMKVAKMVMAQVKERGITAIAIASPTEPTAHHFIQHFGLEDMGNGGYVWHSSQQ